MKKSTFAKKTSLIGLLSILLISTCFVGCDDDCPTQTECPTFPTTRSAFVLNEGIFQVNNSTLTHINLDLGVVTQNYFEQRIKRLLGDTGNDMMIVGDIMYIVVNNSNRLEIVDLKTWTSIKSIEMSKDNVGSSPREIIEHDGKVFVTNFNGYVAVIDSVNNFQNPIDWVKVGTQPEGIVSLNKKIYVANSNYESTTFTTNPGSISIIDPSTLSVEETINNVGHNISGLTRDAYGDLYIISRGNYSDISPGLVVFNSTSKTSDTTFDMGAQLIRINGDEGFISVGAYEPPTYAFVAKVVKLDVKADTLVSDELIASSNFQTLYGLDIEPESGDIYCTDARDYSVSGDVIVFDKNGQKKSMFKTGINPTKVLFFSN